MEGTKLSQNNEHSRLSNIRRLTWTLGSGLRQQGIQVLAKTQVPTASLRRPQPSPITVMRYTDHHNNTTTIELLFPIQLEEITILYLAQ